MKEKSASNQNTAVGVATREKFRHKIVTPELIELVITCLMEGMSHWKIAAIATREIKDRLCLKDPDLYYTPRNQVVKIREVDISVFHRGLKEDVKESISKAAETAMHEKVEQALTKGIDIRNNVVDTIDTLVERELTTGKKDISIVDFKTQTVVEHEVALTPHDKKSVTDILMKKVQVQESLEKVLGLESGGSESKAKVDISISFIDQMKSKISSRRKAADLVVEAEFESEPEASEK